ncbi:hypothetical protein MANES_14G092425v8 [Manihot esculenta]|uniref:Uncharacterized protein n=1 Tax=Manihot esculenta TaxID=3983 RepID=A0ACB7GGY1_MANES|nr:hypothetical protein MANES_14G092425v8 [Manihot esculenta]
MSSFKLAFVLSFLLIGSCMSLSRASGGKRCLSDADCISVKCPEGLSDARCFHNGYCTCKPTQEGSSQFIDGRSSKDAQACKRDSDCTGFCPPKCKYVNCVGGVCFCSC